MTDEDALRLRGWLRQMTLDNTVAVVGTLIITVAFLVLGTELLRPRALVPEENETARVLGRLLGEVWGPVGFWFMVVAVFVGFWDTILSDQDGFGRMFASGARLLRNPGGGSGGGSGGDGRGANQEAAGERRLRRWIVLVVLAAAPTALYLLVGEPVTLLKAAGAIEAAHIPVVTGLTLYLNHRHLPRHLRPTRFATAAASVAGLFFAGFTVFFLVEVL